jgi:predicted aspartyl protease
MNSQVSKELSMGRVICAATIENLQDCWEVKRGLRQSDQIRRIEVPEALVDTGTMSLSLPVSLIRQLGLNQVGTRETLTVGGPRVAARYDTVRLIIQDRDCVIDVLEVPDGIPVLIGQVPLESLDFVVDVTAQKLIGNPAHGGRQMAEMY